MKLDVSEPAFCGVLPRSLNHFRSHVDSDCTAFGSDFWGGKEDIETASATKIYHDLSGMKVCVSGRVSAGQTHVRLGGYG